MPPHSRRSAQYIKCNKGQAVQQKLASLSCSKAASAPVGEVAQLHGHAVFHDLKAEALIKGSVFSLFRHQLQIEVVPVLFLDPLDHGGGNALAVIVRMYQNIVHISH